MDEPLHAEARVRPAVRGVDAQVRARPVVLALLLHPRQGVAADQPAHAHAADDERLWRALACLADALHEHLRVELDLRQAVVEPDDDHVVARRVQRVDHPRCVEQLVHVVAGMAPGEPLHEDHGVDDLPAARGAEDPGHPLLAGLAVGPLRLQRPGVVSARGRRVVGDGQRHPRLERLGAVGAAHRDLRAVARRVGGREHIAERGLDETPAVAEVDRDGVGQRCSGIGEVEALVELEPHVAAAMHRGVATPLAVHVRRRHERLALLDRIGQPRGQRAGLPAVGGPREDALRQRRPRHRDAEARDRDRQRIVGAHVARGRVDQRQRLDRPEPERGVLQQEIQASPLLLGQGRSGRGARREVGVPPPREQAAGNDLLGGLSEQRTDLVRQRRLRRGDHPSTAFGS